MMLWILLALFLPGGRKAWVARADIDVKQFSMNLIWSFLSSASAAVLMMGFPNILKESEANQDDYTKVVLGTLILAISITRSPIMIPLQAFQGVAVSAFLKQQHRPVAAFIKPAAAVLGIGAAGAGAAYLIGPLLFRLIYPPKPETQAVYDHVITGAVLGILVFGSAMLALVTLSGNMVLAINRHRAYVAGWAVAAVVAIAAAFLVPLPLVGRALVALYAGPLSGFIVHVTAMRIHARSAAQAAYDGTTLALCAALLVGKTVVVLLTLRAGAFGGTLTPGLSIGALAGLLLALLVRLLPQTGWVPDVVVPGLGALSQMDLLLSALAGSVGFLAVSMNAPLTAFALVLGFTGQHSAAILPMLAAVTMAMATASLWPAQR